MPIQLVAKLLATQGQLGPCHDGGVWLPQCVGACIHQPQQFQLQISTAGMGLGSTCSAAIISSESEECDCQQCCIVVRWSEGIG